MRRLLHWLAVLAVAAFLPVPASAQTVEDLVAKNLQAKGGIDLIRQTSSVKITGRFKQFPPQGSTSAEPIDMEITTWAKRPNLMRKEATFTPPKGQAPRPGMPSGPIKQVQASDGNAVWVQFGADKPRQLPAAQADPMMKDAEFDSVFVDYKARGITIDLVGRETLDTRAVYHLKVTRKGAPVQHYYLDAETGLEAKVTTEATQGGVTANVETEIGDFRNVDGRMVPFRTRQLVNRQLAAEMLIETVEFNTEMPDSLFKTPAGAVK